MPLAGMRARRTFTHLAVAYGTKRPSNSCRAVLKRSAGCHAITSADIN